MSAREIMEGKSARLYCEHVAALFTRAGKVPPGAYRCVEAWYAAHGEDFQARPRLGSDPRLGKARECFRNAFVAAEARPTWRYAEGFAFSSFGLPIHHAWVVDESGDAVEVTWPEEGTSYFGFALPAAVLRPALLRSKVWGFIPYEAKAVEAILKTRRKA